jgi:aarF domain-containing kinase
MQEARLHEAMLSWSVYTGIAVAAWVFGQFSLVAPAFAIGWGWLAKSLIAWVAITLSLIVYLFSARVSPLRRRLRVMWMAFIVFLRFKSTRIRTRKLQRGTEQYELIWDETHRLIAFFAQAHFKELRGFWVKLGQYCSSRADFLPVPYLEYLGRLQDQMPTETIDVIMATVRTELGDKLANTLSIDKTPLASASIAQVHKATVRSGSGGPDDGSEVIIKVQHDGVDVVMMQDISSFELILSAIAWVEPDFDLRPLIEEWKKASKEELDFTIEAANQTRARDAAISAGLDVIIPRILPAYTRRRILVMAYVDGPKLKDGCAALPALNVEKLARAVVEAFAFQLHIDGHFNADPHPGNLLVERSTLRPVLLDWGLSKTFTNQRRLAFAKLVYAIDAQNIWVMLDAFEEIGFEFKQEDQAHFEPGTFLEVMRFMLRDTNSGDTKEIFRQRSQVDEKKFHNDRKLKRKDPVEQFSGEVLFFLRTVDCLQGMCAGLGVQLPFLSILAEQARIALLKELRGIGKCGVCIQGEDACDNCHVTKGPPLSPHGFLPLPGVATTARGPLQEKVSALLAEFCRNGRALGAQVCVVAGGMTSNPKILVDASGGVLGPLDPRPVTQSTQFVTFSLGQLPLVATLLGIIDQGVFGVDTRLSEGWSAFGGPDKDSISIGHVLARSTGLWHVFPKGLKLGSLLNLGEMLAALEQATPDEHPGTSQAHHYWTFGLFVAGICRHLVGREIGDCWEEMCAALLPASLRAELQLCGADTKGNGNVYTNVAHVQKPPCDGVDVAEIMSAIERMQMEVNATPDDPAWRFFSTILTCEHLLDPQLYNIADAKRADAICGQGVHASARALAVLLERCAANCGGLGRGLRSATEAAVNERALPPPSVSASLQAAPVPLPGILRNIFEHDVEDSMAMDATFHALGFQSLPGVAALMGRPKGVGMRAPESGAFAAWLPDDRGGSSGVSVCLLASRLDVEASGLAEAVLKLVSTGI